MCLLIYKNANVTIPEDHLEAAFDSNPHGAGFTVRLVNDDGTSYLHRERGFFKYNDFIEAYRPFALDQGLVHFRFATAGKKDSDNCHPFEVTENVHVAHNGVIPIEQSISVDFSDTWHFNEQVIKPIHKKNEDLIWKSPAIQFLIGQSIGGSKLAFLHADGRYLLINEEAGHWDDEKSPNIWYSNDSYECRRVCSGFSFRDYSYSYAPSLLPNSKEDEKADRKDHRRLHRARTKLGENDWLVDEALSRGIEPVQILALADDFEALYEETYFQDQIGFKDYRTYGSSFID